jgi:hypothetical protein
MDNLQKQSKAGSSTVIITSVLLAAFMAGMGPFLYTDLLDATKEDKCQELILEASAEPNLMDLKSPLIIQANSMQKDTLFEAGIIGGEFALANIPLEKGKNGKYMGIWSGRNSAGEIVEHGTYTVVLTATQGECTEKKEIQLNVRPALTPFISLQPGSTVALGAYSVNDEGNLISEWESSNPAVARTEGLKIIGVSKGIALITPLNKGSSGYLEAIEVRVE